MSEKLGEMARENMGDAPQPITGGATAEGTAAYCAGRGAALRPAGGVALGRTGLRVSGVGFGGYRIDDSVDEHARALRLALLGGANLIDTSANYGDGGSEVLVGRVMRELIAEGAISREQIVVVTKGGYVQGGNMRLAREREAMGRPFPEMTKVSRDCWHCIGPAFIEEQITLSLARLGMERVDVFLLHNPEYFLERAKHEGTPAGEARAEYERRIAAAFELLERETARGRIGWYGVSSNTFAKPAGDYDFTSLARCLEAARAAARAVGGAGHRFAVVQCPGNLFERGAWGEINQPPASAEDAGDAGGNEHGARGETFLELAWREGLGVLFNRPLNAFAGGGLTRLADPPNAAEAGAAVAARIDALERFEAGLRGTSLITDAEAARPFHVARLAAHHWPSALTARDMSVHIENELIPFARQAVRAFQALERAPENSAEHDALPSPEAYVRELNALIHAMSEAAEAASRADVGPIHEALRPATPPELRDAPLSQKAVWLLRSLGGPTVALVGMRRPAYVEDILRAAAIEPGTLSEAALRELAERLSRLS